jgi:hypothetical protein
MERRRAFALAAAVSMTLVSAAGALGANIGALGFASPSAAPAPAVAPVAATSNTPQPVAAAPAPDPVAATTTKRTEGEREGREHAGTVAPAAAPRGERDD